ncbi:MAG: type IV pilus twitching motility protein PilT [Candidatus Neomarinimicrobiota bacterium]|nr:MAG: type IV pilus twitching motility protein PilT [Candidatus Neomarinimicrobiota bacterium]
MDILELLKFTISAGASDLHLNAGAPPMVRVDGVMKKIDVPDLLPEDIHRLIYDIMTDKDRKRFEETWELDFSRDIGGIGRFRVNVYYQNEGKAAVFRTIPSKILTFEELHLPEVLKSFCFLEKGLVLVTGPTGSGKSTTLAAMVDHINTHRKSHIITIEDPIEFVHKSRNCLISQREVGRDTKSFSNALRSALREDPDVILVGELRDLETISLAISAAETGHLVFGTLHTNSVAKTVDRIVDVFPTNQQEQIRSMFADSIEGVVSQLLLRRKSGKGRVAALEILVATNAVRSLIRENKTHQIKSALQTGSSLGMCTMEQAIRKLIQEGAISVEMAKEILPKLEVET